MNDKIVKVRKRCSKTLGKIRICDIRTKIIKAIERSFLKVSLFVRHWFLGHMNDDVITYKKKGESIHKFETMLSSGLVITRSKV